jgi:hypothetical protein
MLRAEFGCTEFGRTELAAFYRRYRDAATSTDSASSMLVMARAPRLAPRQRRVLITYRRFSH